MIITNLAKISENLTFFFANSPKLAKRVFPDVLADSSASALYCFKDAKGTYRLGWQETRSQPRRPDGRDAQSW
jgi:hypothetical protein